MDAVEKANVTISAEKTIEEMRGLISEGNLNSELADALQKEVDSLIRTDLSLESIIAEMEAEINETISEGKIDENNLREILSDLEKDVEKYEKKGNKTLVFMLSEEINRFKAIQIKVDKKNQLKKRKQDYGVKTFTETSRNTEFLKEIQLLCDSRDKVEKETIDSEVGTLTNLIDQYKGKNEPTIYCALTERLQRLQDVKAKISDNEIKVNLVKEEFRKKWNLDPLAISEIVQRLEKDAAFYKENGLFDIYPLISSKLEIFSYYQKIFSLYEPEINQIIRGKLFKTLKRFKDFNSSNYWNYGSSDKFDAIEFNISENISLLGVGLYMPYESGRNNTLDVVIYSNSDKNTFLYEAKQLSLAFTESTYIHQHFFPKFLKLKKNTQYTIYVKTDGNKSFKGNNGSSTADSNGVTFTFSKSSKDSNGTSSDSGQIPEFYFTMNSS